ncbi:MAG: M14 family zinc carboxypeptidase [Xenococcaceae cyanobacterium]
MGRSVAFVTPEDVEGGLAQDWLVTPSLRPSAENNIFSFDARQVFEGDQGSIYTIRVSTESQTDPNDFEIVQTYSETDFSATEYTTLSADLSAYEGEDVYVALVMENDNGDFFAIDDVGGIAFTPDILVSLSGDELALSRGGTNETLQVSLTTAPTSPITLNFSADTEEISPIESIVFTPENWDKTQIVNLDLAQIGSTGEPETNFDLDITVETEDLIYSSISVDSLEGRIVDMGIPGFSSYRTVEETFDDFAKLAEENPDIASWVDIGDSYDKVTPGGPEGYDIYAIELTNKNSGIEDKPTLYVEGSIHAREYTPAELVSRFAEELVAGYGTDADTTWLLDYFKIAVVPIGNPDGRKFAEQGYLWRKNTNPNPPPGEEPAAFPNYGVDLNRNWGGKWNEIPGGSSGDPSSQTYRGDAPFSEPETQVLRDYLGTLFEENPLEDFETAPSDTSGVFLDVHSSGNLLLYPYGWTDLPAGNKKELETLGRKFGYFTGLDGEAYDVSQSIGLYPTDGTTTTYTYGTFGIASYTFELGTEFFQSNEYFEETIVPEVMPALMYAAKAAYRPYQKPAGPDTIEVSTDLAQVVAGTNVVINATADDGRYDDGEVSPTDSGDEPVQNIAQARYSIDTPSWIEGTEFFSLETVDGELDSSVEEFSATIDTSDLEVGRHTIFLESQDANGNFGVPTAVFIDVVDSPEDAEIVDGTDEAESLIGTQTNQVIYGRDGDDTVAGALGDDLLFGNAGADELFGDRYRVLPSGEEGGDDTIYGGDGEDYIDGKAGDDILYGEGDNDYILGNSGNDLIVGGSGDDTLVGDNLYQSEGNDTFVLEATGTDVINDFSVTDDSIALPKKVSFGELSITQDRQDTLIDYESETIAVLRDVSAETVTETSFVSADSVLT